MGGTKNFTYDDDDDDLPWQSVTKTAEETLKTETYVLGVCSGEGEKKINLYYFTPTLRDRLINPD